jgi:hypothetical protein
VYRLLEWCSQWLLKSQHDIDTSDIPESAIPENIHIPLNERKNVYMASLIQSWDLAGAICDESTESFWSDNRHRVMDLLEMRNQSILAHGYAPIEESQFQEIQEFIAERLLPFMLTHFQTVKIKSIPTQLPSDWPQ